jgi:hypothetical protein
MPDGDPLDFSAKYNTPLGPQGEAQFQQWTQQQSKALGRDVGNDSYDYDLRGWFAKNGPQDLSGAHLTDEFKKPNHPTFSDQSQYHGADGMQGGAWATKPDGSFTFTPGRTNMYSADELGDYFKKVEPGNQLVTGFSVPGTAP